MIVSTAPGPEGKRVVAHVGLVPGEDSPAVETTKAVTPDLFRGPEQRARRRSDPSGPRNKSGVTIEPVRKAVR